MTIIGTFIDRKIGYGNDAMGRHFKWGIEKCVASGVM